MLWRWLKIGLFILFLAGCNTPAASTGAPAPTLKPTFPKGCASDAPLLPKENPVQGSLVIHVYDKSPSYLFNLQTQEKIPFFPDGASVPFSLAVAPDQTRFAYLTLKSIVVVKPDGTQQAQVAMDENWSTLAYWQDNQTLAIRQPAAPGDANNDLLLVNPSTGSKQTVHADFPGLILKEDSAHPIWYKNGHTVYDPTLTRVVYAREPGNPDNQGDIVLWDLQNKKAIGYFKSEGAPYGAPPVWTADGQKFVTALSARNPDTGILYDDLYQVSRDGQVVRLTDFSKYYRDGVLVESYSWSPDGKRIAFWIFHQNHAAGSAEGPSAKFAIVDTSTKKMTLYCDPVDDPWLPFWSPDSRYVVTTGHYEDGRWIFIVDAQQGKAFRLFQSEHDFAEGWLVNP